MDCQIVRDYENLEQVMQISRTKAYKSLKEFLQLTKLAAIGSDSLR